MSYVDPSGSQAWVYLAAHLLELLRNVTWAILAAFATVGACWAGGAAATAAVAALRRPEPGRGEGDDRDPIADEADRGMIEIEAFLAARAIPERHPAEDEGDRSADG